MTQFQSGQSGNPGGKPKQKPFRDALLLALNRDENEFVKGRTKLQAIAESLVNKAVAEDVPAIKEIADRIDGKVPQGVVGGDDGDNPLRFESTSKEQKDAATLAAIAIIKSALAPENAK